MILWNGVYRVSCGPHFDKCTIILGKLELSFEQFPHLFDLLRQLALEPFGLRLPRPVHHFARGDATGTDCRRRGLRYGGKRLVADYLADKPSGGRPITEGLIREIHRQLVEGVRGGAAKPSDYRLVQNYVANSATQRIVYTPPPPQDVPVLMQELVHWSNETTEIHPVLISGIAQFQLVHIHPFVDGNGRTSRLLSTLCLYRAGYDFKRIFTISEYYDRDRPAFYRAIQSVRESDMDMTCWLEFFTEGLSTQMREVTHLGQQAIRRDILVKEHRLNSRQAAAIELMAERGKIAISEMEARFPDTSRRTLQRDLKQLVEKGICEESASSSTDPTKTYALINGTSVSSTG